MKASFSRKFTRVLPLLIPAYIKILQIGLIVKLKSEESLDYLQDEPGIPGRCAEGFFIQGPDIGKYAPEFPQ